MDITDIILLLLTALISFSFLTYNTKYEDFAKGGFFLLIVALFISFPFFIRDFFDRETADFVIHKKIHNSNGYYLKSDKGILRVSEINYLNSDKGDTLIIYKKEINQDLFLTGATILENKKVK